jgi:hypothetical protein
MRISFTENKNLKLFITFNYKLYGINNNLNNFNILLFS